MDIGRVRVFCIHPSGVQKIRFRTKSVGLRESAWHNDDAKPMVLPHLLFKIEKNVQPTGLPDTLTPLQIIA